MMRETFRASFLLLTATPAFAQDAREDWTLLEQPDQRILQATLAYDGAPALSLQCHDGELNWLVSGLEPSRARTRDITLESGGDSDGESWAAIGDGGTAAAPAAGMKVREVSSTGEAALTIGDETPVRRYRLPVPVGSPALARVLTACGHPAVYARDAERIAQRGIPPLGEGRDWEVLPRAARFPRAAERQGVHAGRAAVTCRLEPDRTLSGCEVESEYPVGLGFGEAAVASTRDARLRDKAGVSALIGRLLTFSTTFRRP